MSLDTRAIAIGCDGDIGVLGAGCGDPESQLLRSYYATLCARSRSHSQRRKSTPQA